MEVKDILTFAESKSINPHMLLNLKQLMSHPLGKDTDRLINFLQENTKNLYSKGTSWNGTVNVVGGIFIISTIITILVAYDDNDIEKVCVEYISNPNCDWTQSPNSQQSNAWQCNSGCARWE